MLHSDFERHLTYENRPYTFIDMESGKQIKLNPTQIKEKYSALIKENNKRIKNMCGNYRIDLIEADISKGFHHVLMQYLVKRKKMI